MNFPKRPQSMRTRIKPVFQMLGLPALEDSAGCSSRAAPPRATVRMASNTPRMRRRIPTCSCQYSRGDRASTPQGLVELLSGRGPLSSHPDSSTSRFVPGGTPCFTWWAKGYRQQVARVRHRPEASPVVSLVDVAHLVNSCVNADHLNVTGMVTNHLLDVPLKSSVELVPDDVVDREGANSGTAWVSSSKMEKDAIPSGNLRCPHDPKLVLDICSAFLIFKRNLEEAEDVVIHQAMICVFSKLKDVHIVVGVIKRRRAHHHVESPDGARTFSW